VEVDEQKLFISPTPFGMMAMKAPRRPIGRRGGKVRLDRRAVRPVAKLSSEELPKDQRNRALDAIEKLGSRVTTADVATEVRHAQHQCFPTRSWAKA